MQKPKRTETTTDKESMNISVIVKNKLPAYRPALSSALKQTNKLA
uniref:Uncharacterized protein n=1 Tax=Rhizophora mucronata TaxID=61149 RepID=A0A2P2QY57_RHIMU